MGEYNIMHIGHNLSQKSKQRSVENFKSKKVRKDESRHAISLSWDTITDDPLDIRTLGPYQDIEFCLIQSYLIEFTPSPIIPSTDLITSQSKACDQGGRRVGNPYSEKTKCPQAQPASSIPNTPFHSLGLGFGVMNSEVYQCCFKSFTGLRFAS